MLKTYRQLLISALALALVACSAASNQPSGTPELSQPASSNTAPTPSEAKPRAIGGDRDPHGCLVAAGYSWCEREQACVRPWELARQRGFELTNQSWQKYCQNPANNK